MVESGSAIKTSIIDIELGALFQMKDSQRMKTETRMALPHLRMGIVNLSKTTMTPRT